MQKKVKDFHKRVRLILSFFYIDLIMIILAFITDMLDTKYSKTISYSLIFISILCLLYTILLTNRNHDLIIRAEALLMNENYGTSLDRLHQFQKLMDGNLFHYHFQPIIDVKTGKIFAYEALMRTDPGITSLTPIEILDLATRDDRLYDIEKYTMFNLLKIMKENNELFQTKKLFINSISTHQLTDADYQELFDTYGAYFPNIVIEIAESAILTEATISLIEKRLKASNCQLALEDYGSGCSNESNLLNSNPHYIKIDSSILRYLHLDSKKQHLVTSLVNFAQQNSIKVIAEGIETKEDFEYVITLGVDYIQGFYTAAPAPEFLKNISQDLIEKILENNNESLGDIARKRLYETQGEKVLSPVAMALEMYSDILIKEPELRLIGSQGKVANMSFYIPDNQCCTLILDHVNLSGNDKPTIILGRNCSVTLRLLGDNYISTDGIRVPETSEIIIKGDGNLFLQTERFNRIGIGGNAMEAYGSITLASSGIIRVMTSGNTSIGIGGGHNPNNALIHLVSGTIYVEVSSLNSVAIGSVSGNAKIKIDDCNLTTIIQGSKSVGIGSLRGYLELDTAGNLVIKCTGKHAIGMGSMEDSDGRLSIHGGSINISYSCYFGSAIGSLGGRLSIDILNGDITITGDGSDLVGIGDLTGFGDIKIKNGIISMQLYATNVFPITNIRHHVIIDGGNIQCDFPEDIILTNSFGSPLVARIIMDTDEFNQVVDTVSYSYEYLASYSDRYPYIKVYLPGGINF